jgi:uncharacterized protein with HEPN domain
LSEARFFAQEAAYYQGLPVEAFAGFEPRAVTSYAIIQIFESSRRVPEEVLALAPDLPMRAMRDMRNLLVHAYNDVDIAVLKSTVDHDIPVLIERIERLAAIAADLG